MSKTNSWKREPRVGDIVKWTSEEYFLLSDEFHGGNMKGFYLIALDEKHWSVLTNGWPLETVKRNSEFVCKMPHIDKMIDKAKRIKRTSRKY